MRSGRKDAAGIRIHLNVTRALAAFVLLVASWGVFFGLGERTGRRLANLPKKAGEAREVETRLDDAPAAEGAKAALSPEGMPPEEAAQFRMAEALGEEGLGSALGAPGPDPTPPSPLVVKTRTLAPSASPATVAVPEATRVPMPTPGARVASTPGPAPASTRRPLAPSPAASPAPSPATPSPASAATPSPTTPVARPAPAPKATPGPPSFTVQVASVRTRADAESIMKQLSDHGYSPFLQEYSSRQSGRWYRVRVGHFATKEEAESLAFGLVTIERLRDSRVMQERCAGGGGQAPCRSSPAGRSSASSRGTATSSPSIARSSPTSRPRSPRS